MLASLSTFTASAPRQASLPWSDVNLLIVTDVHSWVAGHPHTDHTPALRDIMQQLATVQGAVVGALRWAINPSDLTPEDEETGQVGDDSWTIVRHALPFRVYGDGPLDFFRHHHAF